MNSEEWRRFNEQMNQRDRDRDPTRHENGVRTNRTLPPPNPDKMSIPRRKGWPRKDTLPITGDITWEDLP